MIDKNYTGMFTTGELSEQATVISSLTHSHTHTHTPPSRQRGFFLSLALLARAAALATSVLCIPCPLSCGVSLGKPVWFYLRGLKIDAAGGFIGKREGEVV